MRISNLEGMIERRVRIQARKIMYYYGLGRAFIVTRIALVSKNVTRRNSQSNLISNIEGVLAIGE